MKLEEILGINEEEMKKLVKKIPSQKIKQIIVYRYGLEDGKYKSLEDVSKKFKITMEVAREYEARGIRTLRNNLPKKSLLEKIKSIFSEK